MSMNVRGCLIHTLLHLKGKPSLAQGFFLLRRRHQHRGDPLEEGLPSLDHDRSGLVSASLPRRPATTAVHPRVPLQRRTIHSSA